MSLYYNVKDIITDPEKKRKLLMTNKLRVEMLYKECYETPKLISVLKFYDDEIKKIEDDIKKNNEVYR